MPRVGQSLELEVNRCHLDRVALCFILGRFARSGLSSPASTDVVVLVVP